MLTSSIDVPYFLIFIGILAFQIIYIIFQWIFIRKSEYLWYLAYMAGMGVYAIMIYDFIPDIHFNGWIINFKNTFDKAIPILSFYFYFRFARVFVAMKVNFVVLCKWIIRLEYLLLIYVAIDLIWKAIGQDRDSAELAFRSLSIILFISSWILIIAFIKEKNKLSYFLVFGAIVINIGNFGAMWMITRQSQNLFVPFDPFLLNSTAIIIDLLAFTSGLSYKSRLSEIEKVNLNNAYTEELIAKLSLQNEMIEIRHHIAKEIHEELGEGISDISIYSGIAQKEITEENSQAKAYLSKIKVRSNEVLATLQDLIWTLSAGNTTFGSLISKIEQMKREELSPNNIQLKLVYSNSVLDSQLRLPFLKTAISVCRKIFNTSVIENISHIEMNLSENELNITIHLPSKDASDHLRLNFEHLDDNKVVFKKVETDKLIFRVPITKYRY